MSGTRAPRAARVLVFADDFSEEGGIRTRIFGELSTISAGAEVSVVAKVRARHIGLLRRTRAGFAAQFPQIRLTQVLVPAHGAIPIVAELGLILNVLILSAAALLTRSTRRIETVYAHNAECTLAGLVLGRLLKVRVVADVHGDEVEESIAVNGWRRGGSRHRFWRRVESIVARRPGLVVCVSEAHKEYLSREYGRSGRTTVIPCCVEDSSVAVSADRWENPASLGLPSADGIWLLYSGSCSKWQMLEAMGAFRESVLRGDRAANVLLLMSDPLCIPEARRLFSDSPKGRTVAISVPHAEVPRKSKIAHAAMLFREDVPLNRISSPTKFAEYIASGVPVIITPSVGDYSRVVSENHLGHVVDLARIGDSSYASDVINSIISDDTARERCLAYARAHLTWSSYGAALLDAYGMGVAGRD